MANAAHVHRAILLSSLLAVSCDKPPPQGSAPSPSVSVITTVASTQDGGVKPSASVVASTNEPTAPNAKPVEVQRYALQGTLGKDTPIRLYVERRGNVLEGTYLNAQSGADVRLRGTMTSDTKFQLSEMGSKGKTTASFDGTFADGVMKGTYKEGKGGKTLIFVTEPLTLAEKSFKHDYAGFIGGKLRIRAHLELDNLKLSGIYRYARSTSNLSIAGMSDARGSFMARESSGEKETGRIDAWFLTPTFIIGRWSSPDGARTLPLVLRASDAYPNIVTLDAGVRVVPQEDFQEVMKNCTSENVYPAFDGLASKEAQTKLNAALRGTNPGTPLLAKSECEGATAELPYEAEASYMVVPYSKRYVGLALTGYSYIGGAHGLGGSSCRVADLTTGKLFTLGSQLSTEGKKKLGEMVTKKLRADNGNVAKLTDAYFFVDEVTVTGTTDVCLEKDGISVDFSPYEIAPYAMGQPTASFSAAEAKGLFEKGTDGEALFP